MEIIKNYEEFHFSLPDIFESYNLEDIIILDIETTGLHRVYSNVVLVGIISFNINSICITQLFANMECEEKDLLLELRKIILDKKLIITYNGQAFDIPYLNTKFLQHEIDFQIEMFKSFDILRVIRKNKSRLKLDNYKLKSVEIFLGIYREDTISGKESIDLYNEFVKSNSKELKEKILLHNFEDILNIIDLMNIFEYCSISSLYEEFKYPLELNPNKKNTLSKVYMDKIQRSYPGYDLFLTFNLFLSEIKLNKNTLLINIITNEFANYDLHYSKNGISISYTKDISNLMIVLPILIFDNQSRTHYFFDIDSITENGRFNSLSLKEKLDLNFKIDEEYHYKNIINYLIKYYCDILYIASSN